VTGSHPDLPGRTLRGSVTFERIEGGAFLRMHSKMDDPEIPEGVAIFGTDDGDNADEGVSRRYGARRGRARTRVDQDSSAATTRPLSSAHWRSGPVSIRNSSNPGITTESSVSR
jgi:hypothetical protein